MGEWKHGTFGCFDNFGICIITYLVPCYTAGKNAEANGESCILYGCLSMLGCIGLWSMTSIRGKTRAAKGIDGSCINDLLCIWFCTLCALVQESQEWDNGGQAMARE
ncbi:protein PLANT CADMIUM RESISTANCE 3-like [Strongylocentrotus purpuratus]|uniref:Uncharacterized protein n=1 Tax=Strongylocentrotus purpuratus TaxID=7668 RepID=A0A7M7SU93_STRPU|nr:protein PLANT CADMIUM RESISTANCE 3-like [Strongylocentrotus purpuratus]XP_030831837.1 protein PLANT CADMIUM RESISTANCE 3-like [Strongylocentrotus purpuratus]|eukprot:XP_003727463.1 PREDICTED: protein PLANT CADMIUM RESISTANCE 3-like [Strongylocentrotus purpuratus]